MIIPLDLDFALKAHRCPMVCVSGAGAGVDSVWEQKKLEARKMLAVGAAESPVSKARCVTRM
jgi:hypothetical protein